MNRANSVKGLKLNTATTGIIFLLLLPWVYGFFGTETNCGIDGAFITSRFCVFNLTLHRYQKK